MNKLSRTITGSIAVLIGILVTVFGAANEAWLVVIIYGIPAFVIGIFIFFNKKEDEIEQIKKSKDK